MNLGIISPINDLKNYDFSDPESILRCKLASLYRLVDLYGWSQSIYNHITVKVSGDLKPLEELDSPTVIDHSINNKVSDKNCPKFLINPFGLLYHEISASKRK